LALKRRDAKQRPGLLVEQTAAAVAAREAIVEPRRQRARRPAVELESRLLNNIVAHAVPVESGLAADMEARESAIGATVDAPQVVE
jgi:hypothetical protein